MDYRYLLFFERRSCLPVLEALAEMAAPCPDGPVTLVVADRTLALPFSQFGDTAELITWDDPAPEWDFMTVLCFEPDEAIEDYLQPRFGDHGESRASYDDQGRAEIGIVYLTVHRDMADWPSGTDDDLVLFEFGTPGSTMSMLFMESESVRRTFVDLLESLDGVYGLLDMEDMGADLVWLRGRERTERLPTAEMPLAEIESFIDSVEPEAFSFKAEALLAAARQVRRDVGGAEFGTHHLLVALVESDVALPDTLGGIDRVAAARHLRGELDRGRVGERVSEEWVCQVADDFARRAGADLVSADHVAAAIVDQGGWALEDAELTPDVTPIPAAEPVEVAGHGVPDAPEDVPDVSFWTPRASTCDPWWRQTLDRFLIWLECEPWAKRLLPCVGGVVLLLLVALAALVMLG